MKLLSKKKKEQPKENIVVLNSGGFDSVVLMNCLYFQSQTQSEGVQIHSLHFHYGARNEAQQQRCVDKVCEKVGAVNKVIDLPKFDWTSSQFYEEGYAYNTQYLEYRNLIFLAYALSYAESVGAKKIYLAILGNGNYADTNNVFLKGMNSFSVKNSGIEIITPFDKCLKTDLITYAIQSGMKTDDYFSCDNPTEDGEPCGYCLDCEDLKEINKTLTIDHPMKAFYQGKYDFSNGLFKKLLSEQPIQEVRALINNDCQLKCEHCFYGFDQMTGEPLTKEEYYKVLKEFVLNYGVKNIHFSGKEPLFNADILWYADRIKKDKLPCTFNLVTNGINLPKYAKQLKNLGIEKIFLSVDDVLDTNGVRSVKGVTEKALDSCNEAGVKVEVFIDLHQNNYNKIKDIITALESRFGVDSYYIRTIRTIGNAEDFDILSGEELNIAWCQLKEVAKATPKKDFAFSVSIEYLDQLEGTELDDDILTCEEMYTDHFADNLMVRAEEYCSRYSGTYTLTPDGYVLGCASEVACPNYADISVGNVKELPLDEIVKRGIEEAYHCNDHFLDHECDGLECSCKKFLKSV